MSATRRGAGRWFERRQRRALAWWGARFRRLPRPDAPAVALFCDFEGHHAGPEGDRFADRGLDRLLAALGSLQLRMTFNVVAELCRTHPRRIERIVAAGHEIACHGWRHERPRELSVGQLDDMLRGARACFAELDLRPIGFRAPESAWSAALLHRLPTHGFRWNAERDAADGPYRITPQVVRVPVATDDWDLAGGETTAGKILDKWNRHIEAAMFARRVIGLGVHEWIIGRFDEFAAGFDSLLRRLKEDGRVRLIGLGEAAGLPHATAEAVR